jgi:hypothetical protein
MVAVPRQARDDNAPARVDKTRWSIVARFGAALYDAVNAEVEAAVRALSGGKEKARSPE